jgi:hypothetical protein
MADEHVSKIELEINGQSLEDFDSVEEPEYDVAKPVRLMNKTGFTKVTRRYDGGSVDYVIPDDEPEFDFTLVEGGTLTIDRLNGTRIIYGGVWVTKVGKTKYDGDNVAKKTIEWSAQTRTEA